MSAINPTKYSTFRILVNRERHPLQPHEQRAGFYSSALAIARKLGATVLDHPGDLTQGGPNTVCKDDSGETVCGIIGVKAPGRPKSTEPKPEFIGPKRPVGRPKGTSTGISLTESKFMLNMPRQLMDRAKAVAADRKLSLSEFIRQCIASQLPD
jgi:hypothetical protein